MPQMGLEVTEGTVAAIHVEVGARVAEGDSLLELETDKALTDVVAPRGGWVRSIVVEVGDTVLVGAELVSLADEADEAETATDTETAETGPAGTEPAETAEPPAETVAATATATGGGARGDRVRAAPVARRAAERLGVSLLEVAGSGPRGRITLKDVERVAAQTGNGASPAAPGAEQLEPLNAIRRAVARRMTQSQAIPQFSLSRDVDTTWLAAEKARLSEETGARLSVNDLLVAALAETVLRHSGLAASYVEADDGATPHLRRREGVNVGLAVATDRGLLVPVLSDVPERSLRELAAERVRLVEAGRTGRLSLEEMSGSTITISSLAGFGVDSFGAMLNPGEAAILAVGRAVERVVPRERGLAIVAMLTLTLTIDHRAMDGATGGAALAELTNLLEGDMAWRA